MRILLILLTAGVLAGIEGCSNSSTPSAPADYYKGIDKLGNYWIYKNQEIDTNGNLVAVSHTDSTWVSGLQFVDGKQATMLVTYSEHDSTASLDTTYVYRSGNKMYAYLPVATSMFDTTGPSSTWTLIADMDAKGSWNAFDTLKVDQEMDLGNAILVFKLSIWATISKTADENIATASGKTYSAKVFTTQTSLAGTVSIKGLPITQPITMTGGARKQYFADGVALVAERTEPSTVTVGDGSMFPPNKTAGSLRTLLRYKIN